MGFDRGNEVTSIAFAAVLHQVRQQRGDLMEVGAVNQVASGRLGRHHVGVRQFFEVKRQGAGRNAQLGRQRTRCVTRWPGHNQRFERSQALDVGQRGQCFYRRGFLQ